MIHDILLGFGIIILINLVMFLISTFFEALLDGNTICIIILILSLSWGIGRVARGSNYDEAIDKSKEALYQQSGMKANVDKFTLWGEDKAKYYASYLGISSYIGIIGYGYRSYKNGCIKIPIYRNQLFIYKDQMKVEIPF